MPNGRSGGFMIQKADLIELISAVPDSAMLGQIFVHSPRPRPVNASEATRFFRSSVPMICRRTRPQSLHYPPVE